MMHLGCDHYRLLRCPLLLGKISYGVEVLRRDGTFKIVRWLGFISRHDASQTPDAKPVKLKISRVDGHDLAEHEFVHGCWTPQGAYAVIDSVVAVVRHDGPLVDPFED